MGHVVVVGGDLSIAGALLLLLARWRGWWPFRGRGRHRAD